MISSPHDSQEPKPAVWLVHAFVQFRPLRLVKTPDFLVRFEMNLGRENGVLFFRVFLFYYVHCTYIGVIFGIAGRPVTH